MTIGIAPSAAEPYVPGILLAAPTKAIDDARGLPANVPSQVAPPRVTAQFAMSAALLLREQNPGAVAVIYMNDTSGFLSPNGLPPCRTNHVDSNGKPLFIYIMG
jgi:hypothetical protein